MILPLPPHPDPRLRKVSKELDLKKLKAGGYDAFFVDLKETMIAANGIGIAAVQVGEHLRVFWVETDGYKGIFINPTIISMSKETEDGEEGCLSVPGKWGMVTRAQRLKIEALNAQGVPFTVKASGLFAKVIQHETDHLNGKLFTDRAADVYDRAPGHKPKR